MKTELKNIPFLLKCGFMKKTLFIHLILTILFIPACSLNVQAEPDIFIRVNQLGFLPEDFKTAVILSNLNLAGNDAAIINNASNDEIYSCSIGKSLGVYGNFKYSYEIDFSPVKTSGDYYIEISNKKSLSFSIKKNIYNGLADTLLQFFRVQRCGYTDPYLHKVCHIADASSLIENKKVINKTYDITGGWHDAGDYVKFLNTTAYATYMLLFSYDFDPAKFGFDKNKNNVADVLEEAKIGLDWLLRCNIDGKKLITQVQDMRDHDVGWRMPEDDQLGFDRPAFIGVGKNLIGIYSAALALGGRIWRDVMNYKEFSDKCLQTAEKYYAIKDRVPDVDSTGTGMYIDKNFEGKLSLGAIELYMLTGKQKYLEDSKIFADSAGSDFWWSWGDINSLAHYRISNYDFRFSEYLKKNLEEFNRRKNNNLFGKGTELSWGTNNTLLGISLQNILWKRLTHDSRFDSVSVYQRDYILGRNPWGVSFISNVGKVCTKNFHHQIGKIKGRLPGGFSAGPATKKFLEGYKIIYEDKDKYSRFQTDADYYRDDTNDYLTNEPTITGNATAIFVFGSLYNNN
jgi:endoglucanase